MMVISAALPLERVVPRRSFRGIRPVVGVSRTAGVALFHRADDLADRFEQVRVAVWLKGRTTPVVTTPSRLGTRAVLPHHPGQRAGAL